MIKTVGDLIAELQKYPLEALVHTASTHDENEGRLLVSMGDGVEDIEFGDGDKLTKAPSANTGRRGLIRC